MDDPFLKCKYCNSLIDFNNIPDYGVCHTCNKRFAIKEDIDYAISSTGTSSFYKWGKEDVIIELEFSNPPIDLLEETWQNTKIIDKNEKRPYKLLPPIKGYHDVLKKRIQHFSTLDHINIDSQEKETISYNTRQTNLNLLGLIKKLPYAIPEQKETIDVFINKHDSIINKVIWLRNKEEHIGIAKWPIPSYIHDNLKLNPEHPNDNYEILNYEFLITLNHTTIEYLLFLLDIDPLTKESWEYRVIENYFIKSE